MENIIDHYNLLIDENNDPVRDVQMMRDYMDKWDGKDFIDELNLDKTKTVLEIGVGTGRLALKTIPNCKHFTGIDFSPKTIERAEENLAHFHNKTLVCDDFFNYEFNYKFDIIYCSLTLWHIKEKLTFIKKIAMSLNNRGRLVLSIVNDQSNEFDYGNRKILMYPDNVENTKKYIETTNLNIIAVTPVEFGTIFTAVKMF